MNAFIEWFKEKNFVSVHAGALYLTLYMTWDAYKWAADFAIHTDKPAADISLIIAAVTVPLSTLQGFIFKVYSDSRK